MEIFKQINPFNYTWNTEKGLLFRAFYWFILLISIYSALIKAELLKLANYFFYFWIILLCLYLITWLINRKNYIYFSKNFCVFFAITVEYLDDNTLLRNYNALISIFKEKLKDNNLSKNIKVIVKHVDIKFSDHSAAEAKTQINEPCTTLIISGMPITSSRETEFKFNFHYEFLRPGKKEEKDKEEFYKKILGSKVAKSLIGRDWKLFDNTESKNKISGNLLNTCTYILALSCASNYRFDDCIQLLTPIREECNKDKLKYGPLIIEIRDLLFKIYLVKYLEASWKFDIKNMKDFAEKMYKYGQQNYDSSLAMAVVSELTDDREMAKEYTRKAENNHPKNNYIFNFNY